MPNEHVLVAGRLLPGNRTGIGLETKLNQLSFSSTIIRFYTNDGSNDYLKAHASGFFWRHANTFWLITNRHVATGRNNFTEAVLSDQGYIPQRISIYPAFMVETGGSPPQSIVRIKLDLNLLNDDGSCRWLEHPDHAASIDIVAIDFALESQLKENQKLICVNDYGFEKLMHLVGQDVFIVGYPFNAVEGVAPATWKRASYALEPGFPLDGRPLMLVDGLTTSGMSGSPVYRVSWGPTLMASGKLMGDVASMAEFVGIYSGRMYSQEAMAASLGLVWRQQVLDEVFAHWDAQRARPDEDASQSQR